MAKVFQKKGYSSNNLKDAQFGEILIFETMFQTWQ
jgi:hypothetical protein